MREWQEIVAFCSGGEEASQSPALRRDGAWPPLRLRPAPKAGSAIRAQFVITRRKAVWQDVPGVRHARGHDGVQSRARAQ